jgi:hypothetical protein
VDSSEHGKGTFRLQKVLAVTGVGGQLLACLERLSSLQLEHFNQACEIWHNWRVYMSAAFVLWILFSKTKQGAITILGLVQFQYGRRVYIFKILFIACNKKYITIEAFNCFLISLLRAYDLLSV